MTARRGPTARPPRRPPGWRAPGPPPAGDRGRPDLRPGPGETLSYLAGDWRLFQRADGHRWSLDDLATAWFAVSGLRERPPARALDLGCGIGSVLMLVAWSFPRARVVGVEAQAVSAALARRSLAWNGADGRCEVRDGDLRDPAAVPEAGTFDLVTGTPPYIPLGAGTVSDRVQRGPACFETRGGIEDYCAAAARALAPGGLFVACMGAAPPERTFEAARAAGLRVTAWQEVIPRTDKPVLFALYAMAHGHGDPPPARPPLVVRDRQGRRTAACLAMREAMGLPPDPEEAASDPGSHPPGPATA